MASAADVVLRSVHATPSTVVLYAVQTTPEDRSAYDVYLYEVDSTPSTVVLRAVPGVAESSGGGTTWQGDASVSVAITVAAEGTRVRLGDAALAVALVTVADGRRVRLGDASAAVALTTVAEGVRFRLGSASVAAALTTSADGVASASAAPRRRSPSRPRATPSRSAAGRPARRSLSLRARPRYGIDSARPRRGSSSSPSRTPTPEPLMATVRLAISLTVSDAALDTDSTPPVMVVEKTIAGLNAYSQKRLLVNNTTKTLWSASAVGEALTSFSFLAIWCDTTGLELELTCNDGDAAEAVATVSLTPGVPFLLGADESRYNPGALTGTADVIDLIRVKNAAATDAVVNMVYAA